MTAMMTSGTVFCRCRSDERHGGPFHEEHRSSNIDHLTSRRGKPDFCRTKELPMARTDDLMEQAPLVFEGTVVRLAASTLATLAASERTIVMQVDTFIRVPDALRGFAGQQITVELRPRTKTAAGEQAICFAEGLMYGEGLAVREIGWQRVSRTS